MDIYFGPVLSYLVEFLPSGNCAFVYPLFFNLFKTCFLLLLICKEKKRAMQH
jgi:hypothetical protein